MNTHLYAPCYNEEMILPYFLRYYEQFTEKMFIFDNMSTDSTSDILKAHPKVVYKQVDTNGEIDDMFYLRVKNEEWKKESIDVDWVICVDVDEFVYHPNILEFLRQCTKDGVTMPKISGYDMVANDYPNYDEQLVEMRKMGVVSHRMDKHCIFNPKMIWPKYLPGAHDVIPCPKENLVMTKNPEIKLLHYKWVRLDLLIAKYATYATRLSAQNIENLWGIHYTMSANEISETFNRLLSNATNVVDSNI